MTEITDVVKLLQTLAKEHNLIIIEGIFLQEESVLFHTPETLLETAVLIASRQDAVFLSLEQLRFDLNDYFQIDDVGDHANRALRKRYGSHSGEICRLFVRWLSGGATVAWIAAETWFSQFMEEREALKGAEEGRIEAQAALAAEELKTAAAAVLVHPDFRGAATRNRGGVAEHLLEAKGFDEEIIWRAVGRLTREASYAVQMAEIGLRGKMDTIAEALSENSDWQFATRVPERKAVAAAFLATLMNGWAPNVGFVEDLRLRTQKLG
jgi:hypothetical protein